MIKLIADIFNGLYDVFNFTIPGFYISVSNIILGCIILTFILLIFKRKGEEK